MASQDQLYTLCGFNQELDWRPLHFVERIPAHRICNACGVLPRVTVFLPCRHVLCESCYEQCLLDDGYACLLDSEQFLSEEAEWRDFPSENLLKRKVKCWNEERGCDMVLAASELCKHFCNDCHRHATSCPECSKLVLRCNVAAHLQSKCRDCAVSLMFGALEKSDFDQKAMMMALNANLDVRVVEMKDRLDQVISNHTAQNDRLNEISHCMNTVKETLLQRFSECGTLDHLASQSAATLSSVRAVEETLIEHCEEARGLVETITDSIKELKQGLEDTKRTVNNLKENNTRSTFQTEVRERLTAESEVLSRTCEGVIALKEAFGKVLDDAARTICRKCAGSVASIGEAKDTEEEGGPRTSNKDRELALNTINIKRYEFLAEAYKAMKDSACSKGSYTHSSQKMYISGYHVSPGLCLIKYGDLVLLRPRLQLHKGVIDEFLQWPFNQNIHLTVKHPSQSKQRQEVGVTGGELKYFGRPKESSNEGCSLTPSSFFVYDLEREGYVIDDKLHIVWELVPKDVTK